MHLLRACEAVQMYMSAEHVLVQPCMTMCEMGQAVINDIAETRHSVSESLHDLAMQC